MYYNHLHFVVIAQKSLFSKCYSSEHVYTYIVYAHYVYKIGVFRVHVYVIVHVKMLYTSTIASFTYL